MAPNIVQNVKQQNFIPKENKMPKDSIEFFRLLFDVDPNMDDKYAIKFIYEEYIGMRERLKAQDDILSLRIFELKEE